MKAMDGIPCRCHDSEIKVMDCISCRCHDSDINAMDWMVYFEVVPE